MKDITRRPSVHEWAFSTAEAYAARGTCGRRKAGAVALDDRGRVVGIGMNGVPSGFTHCIDKPCAGRDDEPGNTDNCLAIHAEANMIINSISTDRIVTVYVTTSPCKGCALLLCNLPNLKSVFFREVYSDIRGIDLLMKRGIRAAQGVGAHLAGQAPIS